MSKVLTVLYSYTGTCRQLARLMCSQQGWPLGEVIETRPRGGAWGFCRGVLDSWFRRQPPIRYAGPPLESFDAVVLVAPIWAYRLASPMRSFVATHKTQLRHVAVVSVMGGSGAPNAVAEVGRLTGRPPLASIAFTTREVVDGSCAARLQSFGVMVEALEDRSDSPRMPAWSTQPL